MADIDDKSIQKIADTYGWDLIKDELVISMANLTATLCSTNMLKTNPGLSFDPNDKNFTDYVYSNRNINFDNIIWQMAEIKIYFEAIKYLMENKYNFRLSGFEDGILKSKSYDVGRIEKFKKWKEENPDKWEAIRMR